MRKYRNSKVKIGDLTFDSKLESEHFVALKYRLRRGEIKDLARQVRIELTQNAQNHKEKVHYIADFMYFDLALGEWVIWDSKGMPTDAYKLKRKWLLDCYRGFLFIEATKNGVKKFKPNGEIELKPKIL